MWQMNIWPWGRLTQPDTKPKVSVGPDGVPIRDGLTYEEDRKRVLDMLCLCGELDGVGPSESYSRYLRRLLDDLIRLKHAAGEY